MCIRDRLVALSDIYADKLCCFPVLYLSQGDSHTIGTPTIIYMSIEGKHNLKMCTQEMHFKVPGKKDYLLQFCSETLVYRVRIHCMCWFHA